MMDDNGYEQAIQHQDVSRRSTYLSIDSIGTGDVPARQPPEIPIATHPTAHHVTAPPQRLRRSQLEMVIIAIFSVLLVSSLVLGIINIVKDLKVQEISAMESSKFNEMRFLGLRNCKDVFDRGFRESGIYFITTLASDHRVYCDMDTDGGGWLVFQKRQNGRESFEQDFSKYGSGFGDLSGEFWLGLAFLHTITTTQNYELRIEVEDFSENRAYARYSSFIIGNKSSNYKLLYGEYTEGNAGNALFEHNNRPFSTRDRDNDNNSTFNCAEEHFGGWWFVGSPYCLSSNLNGRYFQPSTSVPYRGLVWSSFLRNGLSLKSSEMKIRPMS